MITKTPDGMVQMTEAELEDLKHGITPESRAYNEKPRDHPRGEYFNPQTADGIRLRFNEQIDMWRITKERREVVSIRGKVSDIGGIIQKKGRSVAAHECYSTRKLALLAALKEEEAE